MVPNGVTPTEAKMEADQLALKKEQEAKEEEEDPEDPWALTDTVIPTTPWSELTTGGKIHRVLWEYIGRAVTLIFLLYMFICSINLLSSAFQALGGKAAGQIFQNSELLSNPICGIMIGVLVTVLVQSSSTSTSIVVTMVSAGILTVYQAVYIIMGANVGTSVTNTIVSMGQSVNKNEFRRAFGGATVHDMFNWLSVIVILIIEWPTGYLVKLTGAMLPESMDSGGSDVEFLNVIIEPFTKLIIQINKQAIEDSAQGKTDTLVVKRFCEFEERWMGQENVTREIEEDIGNNITTTKNITSLENVTVSVGVERCNALFSQVDWTDAAIGGILLVVSLITLTLCILCIVKLLQAMLKGQVAAILKKVVNANFPGYLSWLTGYVAMAIGAGITILVQSSSIFTSTLTPLVGIGMVTLERMYPLTLGSNIGTTGTGIIAALATSGTKLRPGLQIALCHLMFNISGIIIWYPLPPMRRIPINMAKSLGNITAEYRWFAIFYIIIFFFVLPGFVMVLSLISMWALLGVGLPIVLLLLFILIVNILQEKKPSVLPKRLQSWEWLPEWMRSFRPLDSLFSKCFPCRCCDDIFQREREEDEVEKVVIGLTEKPTSHETNGPYTIEHGYTNAAFVNESGGLSTNL